VGARVVLDADRRAGRCLLDGEVTSADVRAVATVVERHLHRLDVLIVEGEGTTGAEPAAMLALAALRAGCRPQGVAFVMLRPSSALLEALAHEDLGEHLCAGSAAGGP
jgi:hypothetical protein